MRRVHGYGAFHPLRVMARIRVRPGELAREHVTFVRDCASSQTPIQRIIGTHNQGISEFDHSFGVLDGTCRLQLRTALHQELSFLYDGRAIVTLTWLAPWAVLAFRLAD
jgi:hypothetical protein